MAFDGKSIPDNLRATYRGKKAAILVGAGASVGAGLPTWPQFLEAMVAVAEKQNVVAADKAGEYRSLISDPSKYLMIASGLKEDLGSYFAKVVEDTFKAPKPKPTALHQALVKLDKLPFIITTNYDTIIERSYRAEVDDDVSVLTYQDEGELQRRLFAQEFFILKAHGDAQRAGNGIILTERDYRETLYRKRAYQHLLTGMFTMFSMVFVGASMNDPETRLLLNYIADAYPQDSGPSHYAVMAKEQLTAVEQDRWFKDLKVQIVPISSANQYAELTEFLVSLGQS
jgi:hypothetical protein